MQCITRCLALPYTSVTTGLMFFCILFNYTTLRNTKVRRPNVVTNCEHPCLASDYGHSHALLPCIATRPCLTQT